MLLVHYILSLTLWLPVCLWTSNPKKFVFTSSLLCLNLSLVYSYGKETLWQFFPLDPALGKDPKPKPICSESGSQSKRCLVGWVNSQGGRGFSVLTAWQTCKRDWKCLFLRRASPKHNDIISVKKKKIKNIKKKEQKVTADVASVHPSSIHMYVFQSKN